MSGFTRTGLVDILLTQRLMEGPALRPDMADLATAASAAFEE